MRVEKITFCDLVIASCVYSVKGIFKIRKKKIFYYYFIRCNLQLILTYSHLHLIETHY